MWAHAVCLRCTVESMGCPSPHSKKSEATHMFGNTYRSESQGFGSTYIYSRYGTVSPYRIRTTCDIPSAYKAPSTKPTTLRLLRSLCFHRSDRQNAFQPPRDDLLPFTERPTTSPYPLRVGRGDGVPAPVPASR